jgi:uncharacterized membrane protein
LALACWIIEYGHIPKPEAASGHLVVTLAGLALVAASVLAGAVIDRWAQVSSIMLSYGLVIAFAGAMALQFIVDRKGEHTLLYGVITLAAVLAALAWSWRTDSRGALWVAYSAFSIEIFAIYLKKIGSLLGTSAFFLVAGVFVAALSFGAFRLHRETSLQKDQPA